MNYNVLKSKIHAFCWTKIKTLIKTKRNRKWKIPHTVLERRALCFNSCKNRKLIVKLWWVRARKRKKRAFLYRLFWILSEYTYFYISKNITSYTFLLVFKSVKSLQCILNEYLLRDMPIQNTVKNLRWTALEI